MPRSRFKSPTLALRITEEQHARAVKSASGACLIADAIRQQYPELTNVSVDMATIRVSDRRAGERYIYLTPPAAQHVLLSFDQGWPNPVEELTVRRAVKIEPIRRGASAARVAANAKRREELEAKVSSGEKLTRNERNALSHLQAHRPRAKYTRVEVSRAGAGAAPVVRGGPSMPQGPAHPNLLRGSDRHYGAKVSKPGEVFEAAVDAAVQQRMAEGGR